MKKNQTSILIAVVALVVGFGIGYVVHQPQNATANFGGGFAARRTFGAGQGTAGAGMVNGTILSVDPTSLTVQMRDGSSRVIFYSTSTPVLTTTAGSIADLSAQKDVTIIGISNADGSMTAQSIQVRPQGQLGAPIGR